MKQVPSFEAGNASCLLRDSEAAGTWNEERGWLDAKVRRAGCGRVRAWR